MYIYLYVYLITLTCYFLAFSEGWIQMVKSEGLKFEQIGIYWMSFYWSFQSIRLPSPSTQDIAICSKPWSIGLQSERERQISSRTIHPQKPINWEADSPRSKCVLLTTDRLIRDVFHSQALRRNGQRSRTGHPTFGCWIDGATGTVDGSEIRRENHLGWCIKPGVNDGIFKSHQLVIAGFLNHRPFPIPIVYLLPRFRVSNKVVTRWPSKVKISTATLMWLLVSWINIPTLMHLFITLNISTHWKMSMFHVSITIEGLKMVKNKSPYQAIPDMSCIKSSVYNAFQITASSMIRYD